MRLAYSCTSVSDHVGLCQRKAPCEESILHNILRGRESGSGRRGKRRRENRKGESKEKEK